MAIQWTRVENADNLYQCTVTIANGASVSDSISLAGRAICMIAMPAAWTTAYIGFKVAPTIGGTYAGPVKTEAGAVFVATVAASDVILMPASTYRVYGPCVQLLSCASDGTPTNQGAARTITVYSRNFGQ